MSLESPIVKHVSPKKLGHITPLFSSPVSDMTASSAHKPLRILLLLACVDAFSSSVCCIFWFIYTPLIVAPRTCHGFESRKPCVSIMWAESNSHFKYTWMHEYIYCREAPCASGTVSFPSAAALRNGVAWSSKAPHMRPPNRAARCTSHTMEWRREGKRFGSYWKGCSSRFKAPRLAEALIGLLSALDVRPVMSLWRVRAVLAGRLRLHGSGVDGRGGGGAERGMRPRRQTWCPADTLFCGPVLGVAEAGST